MILPININDIKESKLITKRDINYINKNKSNFIMNGYYNNNKLCGVIVFKNNYYQENKLFSIGAINKISLIKMLLEVPNISTHSRIIVPNKYKDEILYFEKKIGILDVTYKTRYMSVYIINTIYKYPLITIYSTINKYLKDLVNIYDCLYWKISIQDIVKYKNFIIKNFFKIRTERLNLYDKDGFIRLLLIYKKNLFNHGEIEYSKKLRDSGYTEVLDSNLSYSDKSFCTICKEKYVTILRYKILTIDVSNFKYKGTFWYYKKVLRNFKEYFDNVFFLDSQNRIINYDIYSFKNSEILIFNSTLKNGLFLDEVKTIFSHFNIIYPNNLEFNSTFIVLKRKVGKENAIKIINKFLYNVSQKETYDNLLHDTFILHYKPLIYSDALTSKALFIILMKSFDEVVKYNRIIIKLLSVSEEKSLRKNLSAAIKKDLNLEDYYLKILLKSNSYPEKDLPKLNKFINSLNEFIRNEDEFIDLIYFIKVFGDKSQDIIDGKIDGLFTEFSIDNRRDKIALLVKNALGNKNKRGLLHNPKKLYSSLSKICPIDNILNASFPIQSSEAILNELAIRNVPIPEDILFWVKIEEKCSPEFLMAGNITNCCMDFGSNKAKVYALEKGFGIISVYDNNVIVSNSLIWIQQDLQYLVLDNIESIAHKNKVNIIKKQYLGMVKYILSAYNLKKAVQGTQYNDIELYVNHPKEKPLKMKINPRNITKKFYTDANYVFPIINKE